MDLEPNGKIKLPGYTYKKGYIINNNPYYVWVGKRTFVGNFTFTQQQGVWKRKLSYGEMHDNKNSKINFCCLDEETYHIFNQSDPITGWGLFIDGEIVGEIIEINFIIF